MTVRAPALPTSSAKPTRKPSRKAIEMFAQIALNRYLREKQAREAQQPASK